MSWAIVAFHLIILLLCKPPLFLEHQRQKCRTDLNEVHFRRQANPWISYGRITTNTLLFSYTHLQFWVPHWAQVQVMVSEVSPVIGLSDTVQAVRKVSLFILDGWFFVSYTKGPSFPAAFLGWMLRWRLQNVVVKFCKFFWGSWIFFMGKPHVNREIGLGCLSSLSWLPSSSFHLWSRGSFCWQSLCQLWQLLAWKINIIECSRGCLECNLTAGNKEKMTSRLS